MGEKICVSLDKWREGKEIDGDGVHEATGFGSVIETWVRWVKGLRYASRKLINDLSSSKIRFEINWMSLYRWRFKNILFKEY